MRFELGLSRLSAREQKLIGVFGVVLVLFVLVGIPGYILSSVASARETNDSIRALLHKMGRSQEVLAERKKHRDQLLMRYQRPAPSLASFIEKAAQQHGLEVPESKDRPDVPRGKGYTERVTVVKMRKIGMLALVKTLEKLVASGHPVSISRLNIKKRTGGPDLFDVELGVSAYDRKEKDKPKSADGDEDDGEDDDEGGAEEKGQRL